jgi:hypothetical protein
MRKTIYTLILMSGALCAISQTPAEKLVAARVKVERAKAALNEAQIELKAVYPVYKKDARMQIKANDRSIGELRSNLTKPLLSPLNDSTKQKIDLLEDRNVALRDRLYINEW